MLSELLEASDGTIVIYGKFGFDELGALLKFGIETPQNHFLVCRPPTKVSPNWPSSSSDTVVGSEMGGTAAFGLHHLISEQLVPFWIILIIIILLLINHLLY